jgi:hypothetical protein
VEDGGQGKEVRNGEEESVAAVARNCLKNKTRFLGGRHASFRNGSHRKPEEQPLQ